MWKEWKEIYKGQKDEFVDADGNQTPAKNEDAKKQFLKTDTELVEMNSNPLSKYDPSLRMIMSEASYEGRETLGGAVTTRQALASAYDVIRLAEKTAYGPVKYVKGQYLPTIIQKGAYYFPVETKQGKVAYVKQTPKKAIERFKQLSRAAINLGADPMDEMGIKSASEIKQILNDSLFNYEFMYHKKVGKKNKERYIFTTASDLNLNTTPLKEMFT